MSVDTNVKRRRHTSAYQLVRQDGIELLVSPELAKDSCHLSVDLKQFWVFRNLKAVVQLADGLELGCR